MLNYFETVFLKGNALSRKRSDRRYDTYSHADNNLDDDDDDDDDVVIGSMTSLTSNERFEQAYLSQYRREPYQNGSRSDSRMSSIREDEPKQGELLVALSVQI